MVTKLAVLGFLIISGIFLLAFGCERFVLFFYRPSLKLPEGLTRSLHWAMRFTGNSGNIPGVVILNEPHPYILVLRGLGSSGTLVLSQGLLALFSEKELEGVLVRCLESLQKPGIVWQTVCCFFAQGIFGLAPKKWSKLLMEERKLTTREEVGLNPISTVAFWMVYPLLESFLRQGRKRMVLRDFFTGPEDFILFKKLAQLAHLSGGSTRQERLLLLLKN